MYNYYYHIYLQITLKHENMEGGSLVLQFYIRNIVILVHLALLSCHSY